MDSFLHKYPAFQLENELLVEGGEMSCGATPIQGNGAPGMSAEQLRIWARSPGMQARHLKMWARSPGMQIRKKWQVARRKQQPIKALELGAISSSL